MGIDVHQRVEPDAIAILVQVGDDHGSLKRQEDTDGLGKLICALLQSASLDSGINLTLQFMEAVTQIVWE